MWRATSGEGQEYPLGENAARAPFEAGNTLEEVCSLGAVKKNVLDGRAEDAVENMQHHR